MIGRVRIAAEGDGDDGCVAAGMAAPMEGGGGGGAREGGGMEWLAEGAGDCEADRDRVFS